MNKKTAGIIVGVAAVGGTGLAIALGTRKGAAGGGGGGGGGAISGFSMPAKLTIVSVVPIQIYDYQIVTLSTKISNLGNKEETHSAMLSIDEAPDYHQPYTITLKPGEEYDWEWSQWVRLATLGQATFHLVGDWDTNNVASVVVRPF